MQAFIRKISLNNPAKMSSIIRTSTGPTAHLLCNMADDGSKLTENCSRFELSYSNVSRELQNCGVTEIKNWSRNEWTGCLIRWTEITADITCSSLKSSKSTHHLNSADITWGGWVRTVTNWLVGNWGQLVYQDVVAFIFYIVANILY